MDKIIVLAHAKINLTLDVIGRRSDGYHNLRSVMQSIALADELEFTKAKAGIEIETDLNLASPQDNLVWKAASLFFASVGITPQVRIKLSKQIPIAAGLAGGSADAAATLWALNKLFHTKLTLPQLQKLGSKLGADIAFCLQGGILLAEGIGNILTPLCQLEPFYLILIKPQYDISTKAIYQSLTPDLFGDHYTQKFLDDLQQGKNPIIQLGNCFEQVTCTLVPEIETWQQRLAQAGSIMSLMSGSGPTVFGVFTTLEHAKKFYSQWHKKCWMVVTAPVHSGLSEGEGGSYNED